MGRTVRARAPLRLGLAGGGTDLASYSDIYGGAVVNATIDRFAHATLTLLDEPVFRAETGDLDRGDEARAVGLAIGDGLSLHRAAYAHICDHHLGGRRPGVRLRTMVDAPPGSGLGSSSAAVVAMVEAFRRAFALSLSPHDVARTAYRIERIDLGLQGGRQDQYAAAFGGINHFAFGRGGDCDVAVAPLAPGAEAVREIESSIVICHTGVSRESHAIVVDQAARIRAGADDALAALHQMKDDAAAMRAAILAGDVPAMARVLDRSWAAKKRTSGRISNPHIEGLWTLAHAHGAIGGKISGAGGGGFLMFLCDPADRARLMRALKGAGGEPDVIRFTRAGAESWVA